ADTADFKKAVEVQLHHAAILEALDDAIITKDLDGIITSWNRAAHRIFGYTEEEVIGRSITIIIPPELRDEENDILRRLRVGQRIDRYETRRVSKDGKTIDVALTIYPVRKYEMQYTYPELGERNVFVSYFPVEGKTGVDRAACVIQDITERK